MSAAFSPIFEGRHLRAAFCPGGRTGADDLLMVTFDFRRTTRQGFSEANFLSSFARQGYAQLSISCRVNDWFINDDTEALERAIMPIAARFARVQALGYSMGGYGAFRFARALRLNGVVAVSPQATIASDAVPEDTRYHEEARRFDTDLGDLASRGRPELRGLILVDPFVRVDLAHARLITQAFPAVRTIALPLAGHPASRLLRESGKTWLLQREAVSPRQTGTAIRAAHRAARRESPLYWAALAKACTHRRPQLAATAGERASECHHRTESERAAARTAQIEGTRRNAMRQQQERAPGCGTA